MRAAPPHNNLFMFTDFFSKNINAQLATLIIASPLDDEEKRGWFEMLPLMNEGEKEELKLNLEEEIDDFYSFEKEKLQAFDAQVSQMVASDR